MIPAGAITAGWLTGKALGFLFGALAYWLIARKVTRGSSRA